MAAVVGWTIYALMQAEASGVTQTNVDAMRKSDDPVVQRLLDDSSGIAQALGLDAGWAVRAKLWRGIRPQPGQELATRSAARQ